MTETDPLGLAKHVLEVRLEKDHSKSRLASGSTAILSALIALHEAVERNTAVLEAAHKPVETSINYGTVVNDVKKLREEAKAAFRFGDRKLTGTKAGDEGVAMTTDTPFWTTPPVDTFDSKGWQKIRQHAGFVDPASAEPTVVASKDGDKPLDPDNAEHATDTPFRPAKVSPVGLTEGADVNTPPRTEREQAATNPGYRKLADGDTARNIIIGTSVGDVTLFKTHNRRYAMWHTVYPGVEDRLKDVVVGEWIATPDSVSDPQTLAMVSLVDAVKFRQTRREFSIAPIKFANGGCVSGPSSGSDTFGSLAHGYRLTSDQVKRLGFPFLDAINRAEKPFTDIETTAAQLNAQHLGRHITVHRSRCNQYADISGELTGIEYTSDQHGVGHSIELDNGRRYAVELDWSVTVHTDYPDVTIGNS